MSNIDRHPKCHMRTALGNCDPIGGFCTSVNEPICEALHKVSRSQGEWIRISSLYSLDRTYRCSVCGKVIDDMPMDEYYDPAYKGCPYCLTRMKGVDDD